MDSAFAIADQDRYRDDSASLPNSIDMSHHLSSLARNRQSSALKDLYRYAARPGMIALAGGLPSPAIFPFLELSAEVYTQDALSITPATAQAGSPDAQDAQTMIKKPSFLSWLFGKKNTETITISKPPSSSSPLDINLNTLLQYSSAQGHPALQAFIREFVSKVYQPAFADWDVLLNVGSTMAWSHVVFMLLEPGDGVLYEEWSYPGAMNTASPLPTHKVSIKVDGEGLIPEDLNKVLEEWDEEKRGFRRPRVLYTVPTGQNPTGATMLAERKKIIYNICVKYDIIIVEDEPYYALYADPWKSRNHSTRFGARYADVEHYKDSKDTDEEFLKKLPPSYLKFDYQGRVIRMDTFSKTICPGSRLGWFTCGPLFTERLLRATEASTQAPSGLAQALVAKLLADTWKYDGYIRWLRGIKATYAMRRDWMCDLFESVFHLEFDQTLTLSPHIKWVTAYERTISGMGGLVMDEKKGYKSKKALVSFVPPTAGMFVWLAVHLSSHHKFAQIKREEGPDGVNKMLYELWTDLAESNVLISPGYFFDAQPGVPHEGTEDFGFFRLSFSSATHEEMESAIKTMYKVFVKFFQEK
ncbi:hypothetical protein NliqN6_0751 [Naganishia liquefaciens]|uniref:Aminotransferase class I/classII large domain-containing protein n=1 Tax=Naganishia liquefaciens TaxID=104408 RepID=A0A8H3TQ97_9TREE|nr:hypothetical protein NliqN6_0751 [Naganishia liquefaciens]